MRLAENELLVTYRLSIALAGTILTMVAKDFDRFPYAFFPKADTDYHGLK